MNYQKEKAKKILFKIISNKIKLYQRKKITSNKLNQGGKRPIFRKL